MKHKKFFQNKKMILIVLLIIIIFFSALPIIIYQTTERPYLIQTLAYDFSVKESVGFMLDSDILHFGGGPVGSGLERGMNVTSKETALVKIYAQGQGDIVISDNDFMVYANQSHPLIFTLTVPTLPFGTYNGTVYFEFYKIN